MQYRERIQEYVTERGAFVGRTAQENFVRSVVKLQEELTEVVLSFQLQGDDEVQQVERAIIDAGEAARRARVMNLLGSISPIAMNSIKAELADVYVVLACLVGTIEILSGSPFDIAEAALTKAQTDVMRRIS